MNSTNFTLYSVIFLTTTPSLELSDTMKRLILITILLAWTGQQIIASKINGKQQEYPRVRNNIRIDEKDSRFLQAQCNLEQPKELDVKIMINLVGYPNLLTNQEIDSIATLILETYNDLNSCQTPYFRIIHAVDILTNLQSFQDEGERVFSLEYLARLTCQGCQENSLLLFYDIDATESDCPCLAPSEVIFQDSFGERMDFLIDEEEIDHVTEFWDAVEMKQLPQCPPVQDFNASSVVVEFFGCPLDLNQSRLDEMAATFLETYNWMNLHNAESCDINFREITSVTPFFEESFLLNSRRGLTKRGQKNKDARNSPQIDHSRALSEDHYYHDATSEDTGYYERNVLDEPYYDHDDSSDFRCDPDYFEVRFDITARCRGCDTNTITLFDRFEDENFFDGFDDDEEDSYDDEDLWLRRRNTAEKSEENYLTRQLEEGDCSCPVDPAFRATTEEDMIEAYGVALEFNARNEFYVEDVIEIERVECAPQVDSFTSAVDMSIASNSESEISQKDLDALVVNFQRSYNDLSQRFCDSNFRSVQDVAVSNQTVTPVTRHRELGLASTTNTSQLPTNFTFKFILKFNFFITGRCRGCPSHFNLFNDASRRILARKEIAESPMVVVSDNKYRRLENEDQCYCAKVNFNLGAPTERDFSERYDTDVQALFNRGNLGSQYAILSLQEYGDDTQELSPLTQEECVVDNDCASDTALTRLCVNNHCLNEGNPRITLTWEGDDDLDLSVFTPGGVRVWYKDDFDPVSGGSFDTRFAQNVEGSHVESIFFPASGRAPGGTYTIEVNPYEEREESDTWTLQVFENGGTEPVLTEVGEGHHSIMYSRVRNS